MKITAPDRALGVFEQGKGFRDGDLTITIGTGCCESTAPFLYENFWPGPDQEEVGSVGDITVFAPAYVRDLYPDDDGMVIDVVDEPAESMSIETELGCRLILRGQGVDLGRDDACETADVAAAELTGSVAPLPAHLQGLHIR
jgi:uncharacterized protein (DUF779 family)